MAALDRHPRDEAAARIAVESMGIELIVDPDCPPGIMYFGELGPPRDRTSISAPGWN